MANVYLETDEGTYLCSLMLSYALTFLVVALIAAVFGFGGIASASAGIAQILFYIFLALFVISLIARVVRG